MTLQTEYAIDRARNRLDALRKAESDCKETIRKLLHGLQAATGCRDKDRVGAAEAIADALADMTYDAREAIDEEISHLERSVEDAEWADLNRSSPVTL
jgi:transposase